MAVSFVFGAQHKLHMCMMHGTPTGCTLQPFFLLCCNTQNACGGHTQGTLDTKAGRRVLTLVLARGGHTVSPAMAVSDLLMDPHAVVPFNAWDDSEDAGQECSWVPNWDAEAWQDVALLG